MAGGNSGKNNNSNTDGSKNLDMMNVEKQNRHIYGTKEFDSSKSTFEISAKELDILIRNNIGNAEELPSGKIELELPIIVGTWKSLDGRYSEQTNRITIHKSKTGYHAVPARKKDKGGK